MTQSPRLVICVGLLLAGVFILQITAQASSEPSQRLALVERVIVTAEAAVADPRWVTGAAWNQFKITLRSPEILALDDRSFLSAFNEAAQLLPFSHFRLHWQSPPEASLAEQPVVALDWPADDVALIRVRGFEGEPEVMAQMMGEVIAASARALIVDLRGNPGGSFPTAVALSRGLRQEAVDAGAFLTRGWYARHGKAPDAEAYQMIAPFEVLELSAFAEQLKREGAARLVLPGHSSDIHQGRLVILTDGQTASTAESFTYLLQRNGALVVGEQTAGAMLSAEFFPLDETFKLFVPVADYVAPDLVRLDGRGVMPDIEIAADQALERALAEITARENSH